MVIDISSIIFAVRVKECAEIIRPLLATGKLDINCVVDSTTGDTLLTHAVRHGNLPAVKILVDAGADINRLAKDSSTPLDIAKRYKDKDSRNIAEFLQSIGGKSAIELNFIMGKKDLAKELGLKSLINAIENNDSNEIDRLLATKGFKELDIINYGIHSLLAFCFEIDRLYPTEEKKSDTIKRCYIEGDTPLTVAIANKNLAAVKILVNAGADINHLDKDSSTPLDIAKRYKDKDSKNIAEFLQSKGGKSGVELNFIMGKKDLAKESGLKSLFNAIKNDDLNEIDRLLATKEFKELDIKNCFHRNGYTPLVVAIRKKKLAAVKILVNAGAGINYLILNSSTPLNIAKRYARRYKDEDSRNIAEFLQSRGGKSSIGQSFSQSFILEQFIQYIEVRQKLEEKQIQAQLNKVKAEGKKAKKSEEEIQQSIDEIEKNRQYKHKDIQEICELLSDGHCAGFVALWAYYTVKNIDWSAMQEISAWDGTEKSLLEHGVVSSSLKPEKNDLVQAFEKTISHIRYLQTEVPPNVIGDTQQFEYDKMFKFLTNSTEDVQKESFIKFTCTSDELIKRLEGLTKSQDADPEKRIIIISNNRHATALIHKKGQYYYYDPNNIGGPVVFKNVRDLVLNPDGIFDALAKKLGRDICNVGFRIRTFVVIDRESKYKTKESKYKAVDTLGNETLSEGLKKNHN